MRRAWLALAGLLPLIAVAQESRDAYLAQFDTNGDHRVSEAEYVAYMGRGFTQMDTNGDGMIERDELPGGRGRVITRAVFEANLKRQFHRLDRHKHGYLNARELTAPPG